jgi:hypothetical protein
MGDSEVSTSLKCEWVAVLSAPVFACNGEDCGWFLPAVALWAGIPVTAWSGWEGTYVCEEKFVMAGATWVQVLEARARADSVVTSLYLVPVSASLAKCCSSTSS